MKKYLFGLFTVIVLLCLLSGQVLASGLSLKKAREEETTKEEKAIKFRGYEWGTSLDVILKENIDSSMKEGIDYGLEDNLLMILNQKVAGFNCSTNYTFNDKEELIAGCYLIKEKHTSEQQYYNDYNVLCDKLISIYGDPYYSTENWIDEFYKGKNGKQGMAIITGALEIFTAWLDEEGIFLSLLIYGDNYDCSIVITYRSVDYESKEDLSGL